MRREAPQKFSDYGPLFFPAGMLIVFFVVPFATMIAVSFFRRDPAGFYSPDFVFDNYARFLSLFFGKVLGFSLFLAVMVAQAGGWASLNFSYWLWDKLLLKVIIGVIIGLLIGRLMGYLLDRLNVVTGIKTFDGFVSLSLTFMTYGLTEYLHGYGFLAVFFTGLSLRYYEKIRGDYKKKMHDFIHEIERLLLTVWIILFGGALINGILELTD